LSLSIVFILVQAREEEEREEERRREEEERAHREEAERFEKKLENAKRKRRNRRATSENVEPTFWQNWRKTIVAIVSIAVVAASIYLYKSVV
jgi:hypothetical protein